MSQPTPTEKVYLEKSKFEKFLFIIGALCFICSPIIALTYQGFFSGRVEEIKFNLIPDAQTLWLASAGFGILGGAFMNYRKFLASIPAGLAASLFMTDFTLFYISFRNSILNYELLLPYFLGFLVGVGVYKVLYRFIYKKRDDEILKSKVNAEIKE
jgi:hypothetical protein